MKRKMKIYIVMGTHGEYSDRTEWPVIALTSNDDAMVYTKKAQALSHELHIQSKNGKINHSKIPEKYKKYDKNIMAGTYDVSGYFINDVDLVVDDEFLKKWLIGINDEKV